MLTSIDVQISRLYAPVSRQVQEIKGCLLLIFFKQQMPPVELLSSCYCYDFRQQFGYFSFAKGVKFSAILYCSTKSTQPCPRACRFAVHFSGIYVVPLTSFSTYRKRLPNLCNVSWLWRIIRRIWANRNGMLYHWRRFPLTANVFQICPTLAGYEKFSVGFEPIRNG